MPLTVVDEIDVLEFDAFTLIHLFFEFESIVIEMLLKHFVCEVDAKLFKRVVLENFWGRRCAR